MIDCDCGTTLKAANDEELAGQVRRHLNEDHPGTEMSDEELSSFVAAKAYDAADA